MPDYPNPYSILWMLAFLTVHYLVMHYTFRIKDDRPFSRNQLIFSIKKWCWMGSYFPYLLFLLSYKFFGEIDWIEYFAKLIVFLFGGAMVWGTFDMAWSKYHFKNFSTMVEGRIRDCTPDKVRTQGTHYKHIGLDTNCKVHIDYVIEGKQYSLTSDRQPIKIFYTFLTGDQVTLEVSSKTPTIARFKTYLFDRTIEPARYEFYNFGVLAAAAGGGAGGGDGDGDDSGGGCGCGCGD